MAEALTGDPETQDGQGGAGIGALGYTQDRRTHDGPIGLRGETKNSFGNRIRR